ncbi:unnamed protein product [Cylicocyclus nassatus]|uniref:Uncharacterized protein n=1 Tax=Cylicocyclus nassatus TaxID=53992 RepID=A0AA36GSB2_CYLNA|nr:unnamed protein product [Cylicocyclus nassatus]
MSTEVDDILKNAQAAAKQSMFAEDLENLSLLEDSRDSFLTALDDPQPGTSERDSPAACSNLRRTIKSARDFMESEAFKTISNDKVTVNGEREKLSIMCTTLQHRALTCAEDRSLLHGRICAIDLALLGSGSYVMNDVFERNLKNVVQTRRNTTSEFSGAGPAMHVCLAWLCHAAQCRVSDVVPGGEIFPDAERYIHERLEQNELPVVDENERSDLAIYQLCRVLDLLAVCDLRAQSPVDRSILIFVICRLILDKNSCCTTQTKASLAIGNILNASSLTKRATLIEFSNIFSLISDDLLNLDLCHQCVRLSMVDPSCCLALFSSLLIHLSERAECEPADLENVSEEVFVNAHLGVIIDVIEDVMEVYSSNNKQKCVIITMFDSSLHPSLFDMISVEQKSQLKGLFQRLKQDLGTSTSPDGALSYRLLRNLIDRYEIQSNKETTTFAGY